MNNSQKIIRLEAALKKTLRREKASKKKLRKKESRCQYCLINGLKKWHWIII